MPKSNWKCALISHFADPPLIRHLSYVLKGILAKRESTLREPCLLPKQVTAAEKRC